MYNKEYAKQYYQDNKERIRANQKQWAANNRGKKRAIMRKYRRNNPKKLLLNSAKVRAKKSNIECTITIDDFEIPDKCPVLGMELQQGEDNWDNSPSLDRIDPNIGYVPGNVHVISLRANRIKYNASVYELQRVFQYFYGLEAGTLE